MNIVGRLVLLFLVFATTVLAQDYTIKELLSHNSDTQILSKLLEKSEYSELATLLNDRIHGYTLFAPSDTALRSILENDNHASNASLILNTLYYHIIHGPVRSEYLLPVQFPETLLTNPGFVNLPGNNSGQVVAVVKDQNEVTLYDGAATLNELVRVIQADLNANNGIVHIIDHVLIPPTSVTSTVRAANLTMFYTAINATNITNGVDTAKGITIFAPSNEALLSALKEGQDLNSSIKTIKNILEYHILNEGIVMYTTNLTNDSSTYTWSTIGGQEVSVKANPDGSTFVNDAKIIHPNILVENGVLHIINKVLLPTNTSQGNSSWGDEILFPNGSSPIFDNGTIGNPSNSGAASIAGVNVPLTGLFVGIVLCILNGFLQF